MRKKEKKVLRFMIEKAFHRGAAGLTDTVGVFNEHEVARLNGVVGRDVSAFSLSPIPNGDNLENVTAKSYGRRRKKKLSNEMYKIADMLLCFRATSPPTKRKLIH